MLLGRIIGCGLCGVLLVGAGGCTYPIAKQYRLEARKGVTIAHVQEDLDAYKGLTVIWGGIVLHTMNEANGTDLMILRTPLDATGFPHGRPEAEGRFIARSGQFLDPEVFRRGRRVTLAGEITGIEPRPLGNMTYDYPVLTILQVHLWPPYIVYRPYPGYRWNYDGWYGPEYWPPYAYPWAHEYGHYGEGEHGEREEHESHGGHRR